MKLSYECFGDIDLADSFFDSLKEDYAEFPAWFDRKKDNRAYVMRDSSNNVCAFLYLKTENDEIKDVAPPLPEKKRLKVGTLKIDAHGTRLGERFIKKVFDHALNEGIDEIYVTIFEKHSALVALFKKYGFQVYGTKNTPNGSEHVLLKSLDMRHAGLLENYPIIQTDTARIYLLSLYPEWHTRLLPDSILTNEDSSIVRDVSHTNSIHKVYLAAMRDLPMLRRGDVIIIYRTGDNAAPAEYRSVITSLCVMEEYRNIGSFKSKDDFMNYCRPYSVFTEDELSQFWANKRYPHIIRFTYNFALPKRLTRGALIADHGLNRDGYWGFMEVTLNQFKSILKAAEFDESLIVH